MTEHRTVNNNCNFVGTEKYFSVALQKNVFTEKEAENTVILEITMSTGEVISIIC